MKFKILTIIFALLLFVIPINIHAEDSSDDTVILGGDPFGIKMFSDGVLVIKTQDVETAEGVCCPASDAGIRVNDVIITAQGEYIKSNEHLSEIIKNSEGQRISLRLKRDEKYINTAVTPVTDKDGIYRAGLWVRDSAAGIGTVTFYCEDNGGFCGLGHGICDRDTGTLMTISSGDVDTAYISSVSKSVDGDVGTLNGYFTSEDIGNAVTNCNEGIYGTIENFTHSGTEIEIASKEEVRTGNAYIYTTVCGTEPKAYEINIERIYTDSSATDMIIRITDKELLQATGGIVQGMSGSPIVQNNKLVGAVTHVIVDDVDCGYGIFAETMMEKLAEVCN